MLCNSILRNILCDCFGIVEDSNMPEYITKFVDDYWRIYRDMAKISYGARRLRNTNTVRLGSF